LKAELGFVESKAARDPVFKQELEAELERVRKFLSLGT